MKILVQIDDYEDLRAYWDMFLVKMPDCDLIDLIYKDDGATIDLVLLLIPAAAPKNLRKIKEFKKGLSKGTDLWVVNVKSFNNQDEMPDAFWDLRIAMEKEMPDCSCFLCPKPQEGEISYFWSSIQRMAGIGAR